WRSHSTFSQWSPKAFLPVRYGSYEHGKQRPPLPYPRAGRDNTELEFPVLQQRAVYANEQWSFDRRQHRDHDIRARADVPGNRNGNGNERSDGSRSDRWAY